MKKKILTISAVVLLLFSTVSCIALWSINLSLKAEVDNLTSSNSIMQTQLEALTRITKDCDKTTNTFIENTIKSLAGLEMHYQELYALIESQLKSDPNHEEESNSVPKEECVEDPFELVTVDIYDREYKVSGNFNSSKELCSTLASFKIEDIKKSVADYGYFFGKTEDCEHYILLIPYVR